ncbi:MAG TPA: Xaa-Pro peptidase family protein [Gemmatimonadaceae bacterium]|nr:Xaa-Pro peptidase family protein [Gemmatimonadaceae bacterium]
MKRRHFLATTAGAAGALALGCTPSASGSSPAAAPEPEHDASLPAVIRALKPLTPAVTPISVQERLGRIEKARRLMVENNLDAIFMEGGSSLFYYTGVRWGLSERPFGVVIPARGEMAWISPGFEEARARELISFGDDVRVWQEDESPYALIASILRDRGIATGQLGIEERVRFFIADGIREAAPQLSLHGAVPVTAGCRMFKSPAEIALMQRANDITIAAYKAAWGTMYDGMPQHEFERNISAAFTALGAGGAVFAQFGKYTAFPHGSATPQVLREGDMVLVDDGVSVEGYQSDITRTGVFGKPTQRQRDIWELERHAQDAAFRAAQVGATCESVDAAARKVITDAGFGPGYKVPGLPHRTGHGIGVDGHEWTNLVKGNKTRIQPGMCFSNEPTIAIYGEFGVRLEDCMYITEDGPRFFTQQAPSIDHLFA